MMRALIIAMCLIITGRVIAQDASAYYMVIEVAAEFSPLDLSNCELWLDASDASTITLDSGRVTNWEDKSTSSNDASQATVSVAPWYELASLNGLNTIGFTQSVANARMGLTTPIDTSIGATGTYFSVFVRTAAAISFVFGDATEQTILFYCLADGTLYFQMHDKGNDFTGTYGVGSYYSTLTTE